MRPGHWRPLLRFAQCTGAWLETDFSPSRHVVSELRCTYQQGALFTSSCRNLSPKATNDDASLATGVCSLLSEHYHPPTFCLCHVMRAELSACDQFKCSGSAFCVDLPAPAPSDEPGGRKCVCEANRIYQEGTGCIPGEGSCWMLWCYGCWLSY